MTNGSTPTPSGIVAIQEVCQMLRKEIGGMKRYIREGYRGKGPRNYKRSDQRIREIVCELLCNDPYVDASDIEVEVRNGEVVMTGSVADRYAKRIAEDLAATILGVVNVESRIHVNEEGRHLQEQERVSLI